MIANIAFLTDTLIKVEKSAVSIDLATHTIVVESPTFAARDTESFFPLSTAMVIVEQLQEFRIIKLLTSRVSTIFVVLDDGNCLAANIDQENS